jgi:hypothetical protein
MEAMNYGRLLLIFGMSYCLNRQEIHPGRDSLLLLGGDTSRWHLLLAGGQSQAKKKPKRSAAWRAGIGFGCWVSLRELADFVVGVFLK